MSGQILVVSGPSGSGKSTLLRKILQDYTDLYFSISSTTREKRDGEIDGVDYHFVSEDEFKAGIEAKEFLEWAQVHKNFYGTSIKPVKEALQAGKVAIFDIDVQGFKMAKEKFGTLITSVFITTKDKVELKKRLFSRATDSDNVIENRLLNAVGEMEHIKEYDYLIINDTLDESYKGLCAILDSMRLKTVNTNLRSLIDKWIGE